MSRKTVSVDFIKNMVNDTLAAAHGDQQYRRALIDMIERVLFQTDNYNGFTYLGIDQVPNGCKPGIRWVGNDPDFTDTDNTRVQYK